VKKVMLFWWGKLTAALTFLILATSVAAVSDLISLQGNVYAGGTPLALGNLQVIIYASSACAASIYDSGSDFNGSIVNGQYDVMLGNASLTALTVDPTVRYLYLETVINGAVQNWASTGGKCLPFSNPFFMSNATIDQRIALAGIGRNYFFNNTVATFDGSQGGYSGMNALCAGEFAGTHLCSLEELLATINDKALQPEWTGFGRYSTGGSKYPLGSSPADDCHGFTDNTLNYLGSFWVFGTGYADAFGGIVNCQQAINLACCKAW
jgi:hypothetical protein